MVDDKLIRLLYKLNCDTKIQVKLHVGMTDIASAGETTGQGSVAAAIISALNLDSGVTKSFATSHHQICYGRIKVNVPLLEISHTGNS